MAEQIDVCPNCSSPRYHVNRDSDHRGGAEAAGKYRCKECSTPFEDPDSRERRSTGETRNGLAKRLADADPDDV